MDITTKKIFSKIGFALFSTMLIISIIQGSLLGLCTVLAPTIIESGWLTYIGLGLGFYLIGYPIFKLMVKKLPNGEIKETKKLSIKEMLTLFLISYFFMIATNIVTMLLLNGMALIKGSEITNPLESVISNSNILGTLIFAGILSPIVEELLFRKVMLNKLRVYGDKIAITTTAVCFGLFHGNFSQFFYATVLGIIFAYVAIRTGTIKYSIILHIAINIIGSVISPLAVSNTIYTAILGLAILCFVISGFILFLKNKKRIYLLPGEKEIENGQVFKTICLNPGMIIFFLFMLINMITILFL